MADELTDARPWARDDTTRWYEEVQALRQAICDYDRGIIDHDELVTIGRGEYVCAPVH